MHTQYSPVSGLTDGGSNMPRNVEMHQQRQEEEDHKLANIHANNARFKYSKKEGNAFNTFVISQVFTRVLVSDIKKVNITFVCSHKVQLSSH